MIKYVVIGDKVISKYDGQEHYVNAKDLIRLYGIDPKECITHESMSGVPLTRSIAGLTVLRPRYDGKYKI